MSVVLEVLESYRSRVLSRDREIQRDLTRRWLRVEEALLDGIEALSRELERAAAVGQPVSRWRLNQLERYQRLLAQLEVEQRRFARYASGLISREQYMAAEDGIEYGYDSVRSLYAEAGLQSPAFDVLDVRAVNAMIGMSGDGTPLDELLRASYPETVTAITDTLIQAVALGYNPRKTARLVRDAMAGNLQRALVVSRTEQMRALRIGNVREYQASGVVRMYRRRASRSSRTCLACLVEDGRLYSVGEQFSDHPNGRCFAEPVVEGIPSPFGQSGLAWFEAQPQEVQRSIMGDAHYHAWRVGEFELKDAARMHSHPVWGEQPQVVPLKQLTGRGEGFAVAAG